jgi:hypothetical protein
MQILNSIKPNHWISMHSAPNKLIFVERKLSSFFIYNIHFVAPFVVPGTLPSGKAHHPHSASYVSGRKSGLSLPNYEHSEIRRPEKLWTWVNTSQQFSFSRRPRSTHSKVLSVGLLVCDLSCKRLNVCFWRTHVFRHVKAQKLLSFNCTIRGCVPWNTFLDVMLRLYFLNCMLEP